MPNDPEPAAEQWPESALPAGSRVTVVHDSEWAGPWEGEFTGTIDRLGTPEFIRHARAHHGELRYWVEFDEPQLDSGGDGPYRKAQIWGRYLRPVPCASAATDASK